MSALCNSQKEEYCPVTHYIFCWYNFRYCSSSHPRISGINELVVFAVAFIVIIIACTQSTYETRETDW